MDLSGEKAKMNRGELYCAFTPELLADRARASAACHAFNTASALTQIGRVNLWNQIVQKPLLELNTPQEALDDLPWVEAPFRCDYGYNIELGNNVYINFGCTILDTCKVKIGSRTLFGPSVSLYPATHPLSAETRNGTKGPEFGAPITIGEDCWICGNVIVLAGVTIGNGSVVGAGSVVTKDVPPNCVVAGSPARIIKRLKVEGSADTSLPTDRPNKELTEKERSKSDVNKLLEKMEKLEMEMKSVSEELKKHL